MTHATPSVPDASMQTRAVTAATIGTALEWFDFTLYGALAATLLPKLFFPAMEPTSALLASLATFGVGLAARPLGAIICGSLGDKFGRRNLMLATVSVMGGGIGIDGIATDVCANRRLGAGAARGAAHHSGLRAGW